MNTRILSGSIALAGSILIASCSSTGTSVGDTISKSRYDTDIANRDAEIEALRNQAAANQASSAERPAFPDELFPPNAQPGHCYARVLIPSVFEETTERVLVSEESETISIVPARYEQAEETVLVREASTRIVTTPAVYKTITEEVIDQPETIEYVSIPATYKEVTEQVLVKPETVKLVSVPAEYETVSETVIDKAAHTAWKKGAGFAGNAIETSVDQSTGEIMCLVEVPATYKTLTKRVLVSPARTEEVVEPAVYDTVTRTVVDQPARVEEKVIPATYKTAWVQVLDQPAKTEEIEVPAEYKTVAVTKEVSPASESRNTVPARYENVTNRTKVSDEMLVWREVLCDVNITSNLVADLQQKLTDEGYYSNKIDGIWGAGTNNAVKSYANAKGLPSGNNYLPIETAEALGMDI